jgi:hypothetical protein
MKTTVYNSEFHDYFTRSDTYKNQFSYEARELIFEWIEQLDADTGQETEFDLVAICCDFQESTIEEIINDYGYMMDPDAIKDRDYIHEFLSDNTQVCGSHDEGEDTYFVYMQF